MAKRHADRETGIGKGGDLQGHERDDTRAALLHACGRQLRSKPVKFSDILRVVDRETLEVSGGLGDGERDGVAVGEEDVGLGRRRWADEASGEREEVLESEGERVFESGKEGFEEVLGSQERELVEVETFHGTTKVP